MLHSVCVWSKFLFFSFANMPIFYLLHHQQSYLQMSAFYFHKKIPSARNKNPEPSEFILRAPANFKMQARPPCFKVQFQPLRYRRTG